MSSHDELREAIQTHAFVTADSGTRITGSGEGARVKWIFDFRALLLQPKWIDQYAELFWETYASKYPFQVCGMESAAISLVAAIVMKSVERGTPVNGFFVRKSRKREGLMKQIEGTITEYPVIMIDDLINSGNTFNKMLKVLNESKKNVSDIFVLLAYRDPNAYEFASTRNIAVSSIFTLRDFDLPLLQTSSLEMPKETFDILYHFQAENPSYEYVVQKSAPAIDEKNVYIGSDAGSFFALNQKSGDVAWEFKIGAHPDGKGIFSSPILWKDTVYFGAYDGNVYAFDAKTGAKRWTYDDADWVGSSPALAPELNLLFIGLEYGLFRKHGSIIAISMSSGKNIWEKRTSHYTHGSPLYIREEGLVVIGSNDGIVYAYDAQTGQERWLYRTGGDIKASLAYDPTRRYVLFGSMDGRFYILSAQTGSPVFAREMGAGMYSTPFVDGNVAFFASLDKQVYALDLSTFHDKWKFTTSGRVFASPILADESLWIGSNDGRLYELDPVTGIMRSFFQATERIVSKIAYNPESKLFFVPTHANGLYCLKRKS